MNFNKNIIIYSDLNKVICQFSREDCKENYIAPLN
jgi:hypothetical protein